MEIGRPNSKNHDRRNLLAKFSFEEDDNTIPAVCKTAVLDFSEEELIEQLMFCLEALPVRFREVIDLYYFKNVSIAGIKAVIGVSESTVRNRLGYGMFLLKKRIFLNLPPAAIRIRESKMDVHLHNGVNGSKNK
ncbi:MAG TPA: sigma factor-like helix-turn-helix DNA-binding protein [Parafilimonas sp.]|nr:sigma factor-like helix-turn-helix DNA-binding protein [Parafilimonas sp.]